MKSIFFVFIIFGLVCIVGTTPMQTASHIQEKRGDVDCGTSKNQMQR